ncbi:MAG: hypothetical protein ACI8ZM_003012 [Crocinitomix sp.]|jgi:hypothetical protein
MKYNNKRLVRFSKFIHYAIAAVLCGFLIALSSVLLDDANQWKEFPHSQTYQNSLLLAEQEVLKDSVSSIVDNFWEEEERFEVQLSAIETDHENAKESFETWLAARGTIGSSDQDQAVLERASELDQYFELERQINSSIDSVKALVRSQDEELEQIQDVINSEDMRANAAWMDAVRTYELTIFFIRFSIIFPILLLGIFFAVKFRKHKYWPLFLGFILFSVYAFFVGLVPYLPSFGGYIRYAVGIILCLGFGIYAINRIRAFIERKRNEMKVSQQERATNVQTDIAEKALEDRICPSCGKDFVIKSWRKLSGKDAKIQTIIQNTKFCRFCGLVLFQDCNTCGTENFAHLPFCSNCGDEVKVGKVSSKPSVELNET